MSIIVLELIIGIFLYITWKRVNNDKVRTEKELKTIESQKINLDNNIQLYNELKLGIEKIESKKFNETKLLAKIYADYRKALIDIYTAKINGLTFSQEAHIRNITKSFNDVLALNKDMEYKISKYEQLFPWLKQFENIDLSIATEQFYEQNNLPYVIYNQAETLKAEKELALQKIEDMNKIAAKRIEEEKKNAYKVISETEAVIRRKEEYISNQIKLIRLYYEEEERKYKKRVSDYIHHEMMRLSNDRWRFNLDTKEVIEELNDKEKSLYNKEQKIFQREAALNDQTKTMKEKEELLLLKIKDIPVLAKYLAQIKEAEDDFIEEKLRLKQNPAIKAANELKKIKAEKRNIQEKSTALEYKLACYEQLAPWLAEVDDEPLDSAYKDVYNPEYDNKEDAAGYWLTKEEYLSLSSQEKYQLALERYAHRNKSNLEIGRDYERYTGYMYEKNGWNVEYRGIIDGFEDRGRDLICKKDGVTHIVQCKYWSSKKTIHENHINQLFGTTVKYFFEQNPHASFEEFINALLIWKTIRPVFRTSTMLSDAAKEFAKCLEIKVVENDKIKEYPMIKCNINEKNNDKIYHLPFDQQYDNVKIDKEGEFFAMTVQEAEKAGFRRAKRWRSQA